MHPIGNRRPLTAAFVLMVLGAWLDAASAQTLTTIRANGSPANRVDLVVMGDGYTESELLKYDADVDAFIAGLFGQSPFAEYRNYFNVHRVDLVSAESGSDHPSRTPPVFKNTALDGTFDCNGIQRLTCANLSKVNTVLSDIQPDMRDLVLVLLNDPEYGGSGGTIAVASTHPDVIEVILHEVGHTLGLLADEYGGPPPPACSTAVEPFEANATTAAGPSIKWNAWIEPGTPLPTPGQSSGIPGLYEGAKYCDSGLFRPTYNSKMRSLFRPFEQINSEQLVKRLYNFASPIDDAAPASSTISFNRDQSQMLQVVALQPVGHALDVAWTVDGVDAGTGGPDLTLSGSLLAAGSHVVEAVVRDRTPLVRNDPIGLLSESRRWTVTVTGSTGSAATATFVRIDATTQGTWRSNYGRDGATVVADAAADPAYARTGPSGEATYAWEPVTADGRALQRITDASRLAATWYGDAFTIDVNLTDGQPHQLALYTVDWDHGGRVQRVDVRDAVTGALLDTRTQSAFDDGQYLVWHVTGHVVIQLTRLAGFNAVVSGLFLDPITAGGSASTATFVRVDATTQGTWRGTYGRDGATVVADAAADPAYARTGPSGEATYAWEPVTADGRALQRITDASRLAATWYSDAFAIDVNLTDGQPHQLALYSVDWDHGGRMQRVDVRDAVTGALLDTRTQSAFDDGQYLVWHVTGHVVIQLTRLAGFNAVVSGLFLDPITAGGSAATATFAGVDATTQGTWRGTYGRDGATVVADAAADPAYARTTPSGEATYAWETVTADGRALQRITDTSRVAATWYGDAFAIDVNLTDGQSHQLALYSVDWDHGGRMQRVDVRDAVTGALLDSRMQSAFDDGQYLVWHVTGHVVIQLTRLAGFNAVVSGLFLDGVGAPLVSMSR